MGCGQRGRLGATLGLLALAGCATIPKGQYGVTDIDWIGVHEMSEEAIESCLVTRERDATTLRLGLGAGKCGQPPFDASPPKLKLWTMPWVEWPLYDPSIFDLDRERIERWYRARGYYDAHVTGVQTYSDGEQITEPTDCDPNESSCKLQVKVQVAEGKPVIVSDVRVEASHGSLSTDVLRGVEKKLTVERGNRWDEHDYEADKQTVQEYLWNHAYARAKVSGRVEIDTEKRTARVTYQLEPGPSCVFGELKVEGIEDKDIPIDLVIQAADLRPGKAYSYDAILDAQQAIFALGVFSSVDIKSKGEGSKVDMVADLRTGRVIRWSGGIGVMSGTLTRSSEQQSVPQWDIHLVAAWEHRNFLGGLRRLRIEERPRAIFLDDFPGIPAGGPRPGNTVSARFEQPGTFERRTQLFVEVTHDFGPDPFGGFFRHDLTSRVGLARPFWRQRVKTSVAIAHDFYDITDDMPPADVSDYRLPYLEQQVTLDLRNNPQRPRLGAYASVLVQEAFQLGGYGSWNYVRVIPDVRGYVPIMWDIVLAARFSLGALVIYDSEKGLDANSAAYGPWPYRLRGGGANSNRGFRPGWLGQVYDKNEDPIGGIRRYEGSLELRVPFGQDFGIVLFGDVGNVSRTKNFEFARLNTSVGFGLRYFTIIGAIRFDAGWRIPSWQYVGSGPVPDEQKVEVGFWPNAAYLTIGEAF